MVVQHRAGRPSAMTSADTQRLVLLASLMTSLLSLAAAAQSAAEPGWPAYGGSAGGGRWSDATEITPANDTRPIRYLLEDGGGRYHRPMDLCSARSHVGV